MYIQEQDYQMVDCEIFYIQGLVAESRLSLGGSKFEKSSHTTNQREFDIYYI